MNGFIRITGRFILSLTVLAAMPLTANAEWRQNNKLKSKSLEVSHSYIKY